MCRLWSSGVIVALLVAVVIIFVRSRDDEAALIIGVDGERPFVVGALTDPRGCSSTLVTEAAGK